MQTAPKTLNEMQRLEALRSLNILDTLPEQDFDQITFLASQICDTPIALISLVDEKRQWFKSKIGLAASETSRDLAFCAHAILSDDAFIVSDSTKDPRFSDNPLVTGVPNVRFYAGIPLISPNGFPIGTVCVIDSKQRTLEPRQIQALKALSDQVTRLLELRLQVAALKNSQQEVYLKSIAIETIVDGVVVQDSKGAIVEFNSAALSVLNLTADQIIGKTSFDPSWRAVREDESEFPGAEHPAMICLRTGKPQRNVVMGIKNSNTETRWIKINSAPIFHLSEKLPSFSVTSFADITDEILAKKHLDKKSSNLRFVLDGIPHMIGLWGADEINLNSNSAFSNFFKKDTSQIKGISMRELLGEDLYNKNKPFINMALDGKVATFERTLLHKDGSVRHTLANFIPNFAENKVVSFLAVVLDITDVRNLEADRRKLEARLAESAKLSALGMLAAGVAHEVNNPLAIIKGQSELLIRKASERTLDFESSLKNLNSIAVTTERIAKIVRALKTYTRESDSDQAIQVNLTEVVEDTVELFRSRLKNAGVELRLQMKPELCVACRPAQISQVIMNLVSNSLDAISDQDQKWIHIKGLIRDGIVHLYIIDSGTGIAKDIAEKMMNPFFTTKEIGRGTGLGLSISAGLINSHGGTLGYCADSANTTFIVTLPESRKENMQKNSSQMQTSEFTA